MTDTQTPRCDRCSRTFTVAVLVALLAVLFGNWLGYERAVQQVQECADARTPDLAISACPRWLR
jgi:hypothetical protein